MPVATSSNIFTFCRSESLELHAVRIKYGNTSFVEDNYEGLRLERIPQLSIDFLRCQLITHKVLQR